MKRQRGRGGRRPVSGNRSYESNGPDVKIRGTASQIHGKYTQYARDAQTAGDRIKAENYLQHAEHYYRLMAASAPARNAMSQTEPDGEDNGDESLVNPMRSEGASFRRRPRRTPESGAADSPGPQQESRSPRSRPHRMARPDLTASYADTSAESALEESPRSALDTLAEKQATISRD